MAAPPYMKLYVADYLADTTHLKRGEHGAYLLLLMAMWRAGGKLPANDAKLAQIAKCSAKEWADIRETVLGFFTRRGGQLTHKRLAAEMAKADHVSGVRKQASDKGVSAKRSKNNNNADAIGAPNADQLGTYIKHQSQKKKPPKPPEGAFPPIFDQAWRAYPDTTTSSRAKSLVAWLKAASAVGPDPLMVAVLAYAAHQAAAGPKAKAAPAFHVWLDRGRYDSFLGSVAPTGPIWAGPREIWDAIAAPPRTAAWANTWLSACTWQDAPVKAVVSASPTTVKRLRSEVGSILDGMGIQVLERAA